MSCSVPWCVHQSKDNIQLFNLPTDEGLRQRWTDKLELAAPICDKLFVCSIHFTDDSFVDTYALFKNLKPDAVPCAKDMVHSIKDSTPQDVTCEPIEKIFISEASTSQQTESVCRACLTKCQTSPMSLLLPDNLSLFQSLTGIILQMDETLPSDLCAKCFATITNWQTFLETCKSNDNVIMKSNSNYKRKNSDKLDNKAKRRHLDESDDEVGEREEDKEQTQFMNKLTSQIKCQSYSGHKAESQLVRLLFDSSSSSSSSSSSENEIETLPGQRGDLL